MRFEYSITRPFLWRWFAPAALLGAFVTLTFLTLINRQSNGPLSVTMRLTNLFSQSL